MTRRSLRVAALATGAALTVSLLATVPAHAEDEPVAATYTCGIPIVGGTVQTTTTYSTNLPDVAYVGEQAPVDVVWSTQGVIGWGTMSQAWNTLGARSMRANSTMAVKIGSETRSVNTTGEGPNNGLVVIQNGQDTVLRGSGPWGTWTPPTTPGQVDVRLPKSFTNRQNFYKDAGGTSGTTLGASTSTTCSRADELVVDSVAVRARSTTTVAADQSQVTEGDAVTLTSDVTTTGGAAAGKVEFVVGEGESARTVLANVVGGRASVILNELAPGSHPVTATFIPTNGFVDRSSSTPLEITVVAAVPATPTTTTLALEQSSISSDQQARATVEVTAESGAPTGSARVMVNGKVVSAPLVDGRATLTLPALRAGSYTVTATYVATNPREYATSNATATLVVTAGAGGDRVETSTWVTVPQGLVAEGTGATVRAGVVAAGAAPRGTVVFTVGEVQRTAVVANGRAVAVLPVLPVGTHEVAAEFVPASGSVFEASEASPITFRVVRPGEPTEPAVLAKNTTTSLTSSGSVPLRGSVRLTARVGVDGGGAAAGQVRFAAGLATVTAPVVDGVATATVRASKAGSMAVSAEFVPADATAQKASSATGFVQVSKLASRVAIKHKVKRKGRLVRATVRVTGPGSTCGSPAMVVLRQGSTTVASVARVIPCSGKILAKVPVPRAGKYVLSVEYTGSAELNGSRGAVKIKVKRPKKK